MPLIRRRTLSAWLAVCTLSAGLPGCSTTAMDGPPLRLADRGANAVSLWSELGAAVVVLPPLPAGTPEERRPIFPADMATLHLAIHRAVTAAPDASREAAAHAAGHAVMKALFPQRSASYQGAYEAAMAALPEGPVRDEGLRIGAEQAARVLARRADDGRWTPLAPYVPGTAPGRFRGVDPINRMLPAMRPFVIDAADRYRPVPPPALDSATWRSDLAEVRARGGAGTPATAQEEESARFHTNPPQQYWTRNLARLARSQTSLVDSARLMALLWVTQHDATIACFAAKYHYDRWRPMSAIAEIDPAWKPRVPTPNHPEYPAAHGCATGAFAQNLSDHFGTRRIAFAFDSTVTGTTHDWPTLDAAVEEVREARIVGGMHFRFGVLAGEKLGADVARHVAAHLDDVR